MTSSTRKRNWTTASLLMVFSGLGCSHTNEKCPIPLPSTRTRTIGQLQATDEPIVLNDEAMQQRQWPQSVSLYGNGTVQAFALRWPYEGMETDYDESNIIADPVFFVVETMSLPFRIALEPPGTMTNYAGQVVPPTYNAMPPLPPEPGAPPQPTAGSQFKKWVHDRRVGVQDLITGKHASRKASPANNSNQSEPSTLPMTEPASTEPSTTSPAATEPVPTQPVSQPVTLQ